jgi:hypothetical protein
MRATDMRARVLDADVRVYVTDKNDTTGNFRKAWALWFKTWTEWYDKTLGTKLANLFSSDEIADQATKYEQDLARYQATYATLKDEGGKPLPSNAPLVPVTPVPKPAEQEGVPLWWFLAGVAIIGTGVFIYWRLKKTSQMISARTKVLEEDVLPLALVPAVGPLAPAFAKAASARDALHVPTCGDCGRDLEVTPVPRAATKYYLSGV